MVNSVGPLNFILDAMTIEEKRKLCYTEQIENHFICGVLREKHCLVSEVATVNFISLRLCDDIH